MLNYIAMWDFSTDPEFQAHLDWMRDVRAREDLAAGGPRPRLRPDRCARWRRCRSEVKERGLWAAHLDPELGGQGFGQVKLGLMHEVLGTTPIAPFAFGNQAPDSGNSEILALAGTPEQKERYLHPLLAGDLHSAFSMTEPDTRGLGPDARCARARCATATSTSSPATSGSRRTRRSPTSSSSWRSPTPTRARTSARRCSSSTPTRRA